MVNQIDNSGTDNASILAYSINRRMVKLANPLRDDFMVRYLRLGITELLQIEARMNGRKTLCSQYFVCVKTSCSHIYINFSLHIYKKEQCKYVTSLWVE